MKAGIAEVCFISDFSLHSRTAPNGRKQAFVSLDYRCKQSCFLSLFKQTNILYIGSDRFSRDRILFDSVDNANARNGSARSGSSCGVEK